MSDRIRGQRWPQRWRVPAFLLSLVFFAAPALCATSAPTDWDYRVRPGDNVWDLAGRYMKREVPWQKLQDYNHIADPLHLPPGMTVHVPIAWLRVGPAQARVVAVIGDAQAKLPEDGKNVAVVQGASFGYGAELTTGADASLTLELADGSRVLMQSNSELALDRLSEYGRTGMVDTRMRLKRGRVSSDVIPLSGSAARFTVSTPNTISSVRGTHFRVVADDTQDVARTEVVSGHVDVGNDKRHVMVNGGRGVATTGTANPGQPEPLPDAPTIDCPREPVTQLQAPVHWQPVPQAAHYRVQVALSDRFEALLLDKVVDGTEAALPLLPDGEHAVRVRAIAQDQLEGIDAVCRFSIAAHPQPPLILQPQPNAKVRATRPSFSWTENQDAASYAWQLSRDASFDTPLAEQPAVKTSEVRAPESLPYGRYYWRVASRDHDGKLGPYTQALPFELVPEPPAPAPGEPTSHRGGLVLSWPQGAEGQSYRVQLAREPGFAHPAIDQTLATPELKLDKLRSGTWYVRVQTLDTDGYAGPWGATQKTRIGCAACRWALIGGGAALVLLML